MEGMQKIGKVLVSPLEPTFRTYTFSTFEWSVGAYSTDIDSLYKMLNKTVNKLSSGRSVILNMGLSRIGSPTRFEIGQQYVLEFLYTPQMSMLTIVLRRGNIRIMIHVKSDGNIYIDSNVPLSEDAILNILSMAREAFKILKRTLQVYS